MKVSPAIALTALWSCLPTTNAIALDLSNTASIKQAAATVAKGLLNYYHGNESGQVPGLLPFPPYYWWEAGAMFGSLINYWYYTGDSQYNALVTQALQFQIGPNQNYMPQNQSSSEGNDDQAFWAFAVLNAAEQNFPNPPDSEPQWIALAQGVFNSQAQRWDTTSCGGGLHWQIFPLNPGYTYKNSISNGCFFQIAARLGAYTGNSTYFYWANRMWDWSTAIGIVTSSWDVWDGTTATNNCSDYNHDQWTYNYGVFLYGAAVMWNQTNGTEQALWKSRVQGLLDSSKIFFTNASIMYEGCENYNNCNADQASFKAYFSRWLTMTTKIAPWTAETIMPSIQISATAAAASCSGGSDGVTCGTKWTTGGWDNTYGVGQQLSALEVIQSNLINLVQGPVSNFTGGTAKGNPGAGTQTQAPGRLLPPITTGDKAGAGVLTAFVIITFLTLGWWLIVD